MKTPATTKSDMIRLLRERLPEFEARDLAYAVAIVFDSMAEALVAGDRIELRDFGVFSVRTREPRAGRNPKTGAPVSIPARRTLLFKPGKQLKEMVDNQ